MLQSGTSPGEAGSYNELLCTHRWRTCRRRVPSTAPTALPTACAPCRNAHYTHAPFCAAGRRDNTSDVGANASATGRACRLPPDNRPVADRAALVLRQLLNMPCLASARSTPLRLRAQSRPWTQNHAEWLCCTAQDCSEFGGAMQGQIYSSPSSFGKRRLKPTPPDSVETTTTREATVSMSMPANPPTSLRPMKARTRAMAGLR